MMRNTISLALAVLLSSPVLAQVPGENFPGHGNTSVAMTLYQVLTAGNGQQYYLSRHGQAVALPGAGCADNNAVAVFTGNGGETWYVDRTGRQVDLEPISPPPSRRGSYAGQQVEPYEAQPQTASQATQPQTQQSSGSSSSGSALASGIGAAAGALAGSLAGGLMNRGGGGGGDNGGGGGMPGGNGGGIPPYGTPTYPSANGQPPYYMNHGQRIYINNINENHLHQWNDQHRFYDREVKNDDGRYHKNSWPGKENGFPRPGSEPNREFAANPEEQKGLSSEMKKTSGAEEKTAAEEKHSRAVEKSAAEEKHSRAAEKSAVEEKHSKGEHHSSSSKHGK